jgi:hypothetical protein
MIDAVNYRLFHGTSSYFAREIFQNGANDKFLQEIGAIDLGNKIADRICEIAGISRGDWLPGDVFPDADPDDLGYVTNGLFGTDSGFQYGFFFASLNRDVAESYAQCHPHGSEYLRAIGAGLRVLNKCDDYLAEGQYSRLKEIWLLRHQPAVVEITGIPFHRWCGTKEDEDPAVMLSEYEEFKHDPSVRFPFAVRIIGLRPKEVTDIHYL